MNFHVVFVVNKEIMKREAFLCASQYCSLSTNMAFLWKFWLLLFAVSAHSFPTSTIFNSSSEGDASENTHEEDGNLNTDPKFGLIAHPTDQKVNGLSTYMNVVKLLHDQSLQEFHDDMPPGVLRSSLPPWNDVSISCLAPQGMVLPRRYVVWGLYQALNFLAKNSFKVTQFYLYYDDKPAGFILVTAKGQLNLGDGEGTNMSMNAQLWEKIPNDPENGVKNPNNTTTIANSAYDSDVSEVPNARVISIPGSFLLISAMLVRLAEHNAYAQLKNFDLYNNDFETYCAVQNAQAAEETHPPYYAIIDGLWDMAKYMTEMRKFREIYADINNHGRFFARITLKRSNIATELPTNGSATQR